MAVEGTHTNIIKVIMAVLALVMIVLIVIMMASTMSREHISFEKNGMLFTINEVKGTWIPDSPVIFVEGSNELVKVTYIVPSNYFDEEKYYDYTVRVNNGDVNVDIGINKADTWYEATVAGDKSKNIVPCYMIVATNKESGDEFIQAFGGIGCYAS